MTDAPELAAAHAAFQRADFAGAIALAAPLLAARPDFEPALVLTANAALKTGQLAVAIPALGRLARLRPDLPQYARILSQAHNRAGSALRREQRDPEAERAFTAAVQAWPDNADALFNLALLYGLARAHERALPLWRRLRTLRPDDDESRLEYAVTLALTDQADQARLELDAVKPPAGSDPAVGLRYAEALALTDQPVRAAELLESLALTPEHEPRLSALGDLLARASVIPAAQAAYLRAHALLGHGRVAPGLLSLFAARLALPSVYADNADIDRHRRRWIENVAGLDAELTPARIDACERRLVQLAFGNFYLAYHGRDDLPLQSRYGDLLARLAPAFAPEIVAETSAPRRGRGRIGLVSSSFRACTAGSYFASWVRLLADAGYEVEVFQLGPGFDDFTTELAAPAQRLHRVEAGVSTLAATLAGSRFDLLLYPELGMDARLLPVAALRLARRQACAWGHPVTTGLPTMDAFFSCAEMEPADGQAHYRERLCLLPGLGTDYARPPLPVPLQRAALGLPDRRLYLMPHSLFKLHPDNDPVFAAIAAADPQGVLVLFQGEGRGTLAPFRRRLEAALRAAGADPARQLLFLPMGNRERFLRINQACDVMVDSLHWSGGNTSIDALLAGLPVVTCPGRFMRARQSEAMLRRMGLGELVMADGQALAAAAVAIANDPQRRTDLSRRILDGLPALFATDGLAQALTGHVDALLAD
jgi:CRISPR-associated protein Csy1